MSGYTYPDPDLQLQRYVERVRSLVSDRRPLKNRAEDVAQAAGEFAAAGMQIPDCCRQIGDHGPYGRNLLYRDPDYGFVLIAMIWPAGCDAPIHDHGTWCAVGVLEGRVQICCYERDDEQRAELSVVSDKVAGVGDSCLVLPPLTDVHKVWNPFESDALTLHTYGRHIQACSTFDLERGCESTAESLGYCNLS